MPMEGVEKGHIMAYEEKLEIPENHQKRPSERYKEATAQRARRKLKMPILAFLLCGFVFQSGCATIMNGPYQDIPVTSEPSGVKVRCSTGVSVTTPGSFKLVRNKDYTLSAEYLDCEPQQKELRHKLHGAFWTYTLIWGATSGAVDLATGASDEIVPKAIHFDFTSEGQAAAHRQNSYLESNPEASKEVRFAILNGLAKKGMTKEELTASLGTPDLMDQEGDYEVFVYDEPKAQRYYLQNGILKGTVFRKKNQRKWSRLTP